MLTYLQVYLDSIPSHWSVYPFTNCCCCSVTHLCPTLCDTMDCRMPGFPVLCYFLEFTETHVHWVGDAIQSSCPLSPLSPPAFNLFQHQGLFKWVSSSHHMAKLLELQLQFFQWIFRVDFLYDWLVSSPSCTRDSQESSPAPQFKGISSLVLSIFYCPVLTFIHDSWKNHSFD